MKRTDLVAAGIIFLLILLALINLGRGGGGSASDFGEKIAVIPLNGVIMDSREFIETLNDMAARQSVKGIIIAVNSPGGGTTASEEIYRALLRASDKYGKPIFTSISTVGASGGYFAALGTDRIYASPTSLTGSIGVIMDLPQWTGLMETLGIDMNRFRSGDLKGAGSPYQEMSGDEAGYFQELVDDVYDQFIGITAERRAMDIEQVRPLARGQAFTGRQAFENGLIDEIGTLQDAVDSLAQLLDLGDDPRLIYPGRKEVSLFDLIFGDINGIFSVFINTPTLQMIYK